MEHFPTTEKGKWQYFSAAVAEPSQCVLDCVQLRSGSGSAVHQQCRMTRRQTCAKGRQIVWNFQPSELESDALPLRQSSNGKTRNSAKRSKCQGTAVPYPLGFRPRLSRASCVLRTAVRFLAGLPWLLSDELELSFGGSP